MRFIVAVCSVSYRGRLSTDLAPAIRAIMLKADDSVAVHSEENAIKPLNWMAAPTIVETPDYHMGGETLWVFANKKERLEIKLETVLSDTQCTLDVGFNDLNKRGTELQLQERIAENPAVLGGEYIFVGREVHTGAGPVDVVVENTFGDIVAVEVKRTATLNAVDQLGRYVEALKNNPDYAGKNVIGLLAAYDVRPRARKLAETRGFEWVEIHTPESDS